MKVKPQTKHLKPIWPQIDQK